jgi:hypothetical protein
MEVSDGDRGGNSKTEDATNEGAEAIGRGQPAEFGDRCHRACHAKDAADDGAGEEPGLPGCIAEDGAEHGAEARQHPSGEEYGNGLQEDLPRAEEEVMP